MAHLLTANATLRRCIDGRPSAAGPGRGGSGGSASAVDVSIDASVDTIGVDVSGVDDAEGGVDDKEDESVGRVRVPGEVSSVASGGGGGRGSRNASGCGGEAFDLYKELLRSGF